MITAWDAGSVAVGFVGLSGFLAALRESRRWSRHQRFFRLQRNEPVDMVLTTSDQGYGGHHLQYFRPTTAMGNLKAATEIAQGIGFRSTRRPIRVAVSVDVETSLKGDLVTVGLPGKNAISAMMLEYLNAQYPNLGLSVTESPDLREIRLGTFSTGDYEPTVQAGTQFPVNDYALIVLWVNPLTTRRRRLIWCGGFTAYSTAAAARYVMDDILSDRLARLRAQSPSIPRLWDANWICFAMVIEVKLANDQVVDIKERGFCHLPDPGPPPFAQSSASEDGHVT